MLLRGTLSQDWVKVLGKVNSGLNDTPIQRLGWLKPNNATSEISSVLIDQAKEKYHIPIVKEPTYSEQKENATNYRGDLNVNDYVYKDFDSKLFDKSFDVSVRIMWLLLQIFLRYC